MILSRQLVCNNLLVGPIMSWYNFLRKLLNSHCFRKGFSVENKILEGMTRKKIRDWENQKLFTGFRDTTDSFSGNRDPIPPYSTGA